MQYHSSDLVVVGKTDISIIQSVEMVTIFMTVYTDSHLGLAFLELQECRVFHQTHPYRGCPKPRITHCSHSEIQYTCNTWHIGDQDSFAQISLIPRPFICSMYITSNIFLTMLTVIHAWVSLAWE